MRKSAVTAKVETPPNPFWDEAASLFVFPVDRYDDGLWTAVRMRRFEKQLKSVEERDNYCRRYAWAVPDPDSLQFVAEHLGPRAVEIGAGLGYWAWQLSLRGVDILAYDSAPPDKVINDFCIPREVSIRDAEIAQEAYEEAIGGKSPGIFPKLWYPVELGGPEALAQHSDRTLFLCWPPYATPMADRCLQHYQGNRLVYIGEHGGCNGDDDFFERLEAQWNEVAGHRIVSWFGIHDAIAVYERK
jgi:hypothetical protein